MNWEINIEKPTLQYGGNQIVFFLAAGANITVIVSICIFV
jgi:hypothetical protein